MLEMRLRKNLDIPLLLLTYALALLGVLVLYSATRGDPGAFYKKQAIWLVLGTIGMVFAARTDYHLVTRFAKHLYWINLVLLLFVMRFAPVINGARRWIRFGGFQFQPSELAKLAMILCLAIFLAQNQERIREPKTLAKSFLMILPPIALIYKQPDLGTALVIVAVWFGMTFIAGAKVRHLLALVLGGLGLFAALWFSGHLSEFQKNRIRAFINPALDPKGVGYHVAQARIAIGSGQMWGKGLFNSTLVRNGYIPEKQTDFIFTTVGEEFGFVGSVAVCLLFGGLILRGVLIVSVAEEDPLGKLIATGIVTMWAFHIIENIGMNVGVMPVAGVPLPFLSSGGTNLMLNLVCVGVLQSVLLNRHQLLFR